MPRTCAAANPSPRQRYQNLWNASIVKARSRRDAWGCLVAEDKDKKSQIKVILFPKQIKKFFIGSNDNKVHFTMLGDAIDPVHAIFTWSGSDSRRSCAYTVAGTGSHGLLVDGYVVHKEAVELVSGCQVRLGDIVYVFRSYDLGQPSPYTGQTSDMYQFRKHIGKGGYGSVSIADAREPTREGIVRKTVAVKVIRITENANWDLVEQDHKKYSREILGLSNLRHDNILEFIGARSQEDRCEIIMEYMDGVDLFVYFGHMGKLPMALVRRIAFQICHGVAFIHSKGFLHRDLKPENLLFDPATGKIKIIDFGLLRPKFDQNKVFKKKKKPQTFLERVAEWLGVLEDDEFPDELTYGEGSASYMAPEQALDDFEYDERVDSYPVSVMAFMFMTGERAHPNTSRNCAAIVRREMGWLARLTMLEDSVTAIDFVTKIGQFNPQNRMTLAEALNHPWLAEKSDAAELAALKEFKAREREMKKVPSGSIRSHSGSCSTCTEEEMDVDIGEIKPSGSGSIRLHAPECSTCENQLTP